MISGDYILVIAPEGYEGNIYRGKYCYEHHLVYWKTHGIILKKGEIIHHIDGNKHNNSPENLELKTNSAHVTYHNKAKGYKYAMLKCPNCKKEFERKLNRTHIQKTGASYTACSRQCSGFFSNKRDKDEGIKENIISVYRKFQD